VPDLRDHLRPDRDPGCVAVTAQIPETPVPERPHGSLPGPAHVRRVVETLLPTDWATFHCVGYLAGDGTEQVALVLGDPSGRPLLVRLHSECLTGDLFGSRRCDCGQQLQETFRLIAAEGRGVVVYLRGHEGRGIGLLDKLRAYRLQDDGFDTVDANVELGLPVDARDFAVGAAILADLGAVRVRLLTNNPAKPQGLERHGITVVALEPLVIDANEHNTRYLSTKRDRLGHALP
jgi:3,4-dihydroxy 2-butanone 4-phosphate synthase / GTP cyclohydrolase II